MYKQWFNNKIGYVQKNWTHMGRRVLTLVLSLAMLISLFTPIQTVYADNENTSSVTNDSTAATSSALSDMYVLRAETGVNSGENVLFIGVRYKDSHGITRTDYIFPNEGAMKDSMEAAEAFGTPYKQKLSLMANNDGYLADTSFLTGETTLQSNTTDDYLLTLSYSATEFLGFDVMMSNRNGGSNRWTCKALQLYKAESVSGYDLVGYYSNNMYLSFTGTLVGELKDKNFTFESGVMDRLYRVRTNLKGSVETERTFLVPESGEATRYDAETSMMLKIDFADIKGAGIEGLTQTWDSSVTTSEWNSVSENLVLRVKYTTLSGTTREVYVPAILSTLCYLKRDNSFANDILFGLAQMGDSLAVPLVLPGINVDVMPEISLIYGSGKGLASCGVSNKSGSIASDSINIIGVQLYPSMSGLSIENYVLSVNATSSPLYYYTSNSNNGFSLNAGDTHDLKNEMRLYDASVNPALSPSDYENRYLVTLTTDSPAMSGTTDRLMMDLTYTNYNGDTRTITGIDVKDCVEQFYGEWPTNPSGGAYAVKASAGQSMSFFLQINDVRSFTSVKFYLSGGGSDDWQFKSITIDGVVNYSSRQIGLNTSSNNGTAYASKWNITRSVKTTFEQLKSHYVDFSETVLIQSGADGGKTVDFGSTTGEVVHKNDVDWTNYIYSMSYEDTLQDMGYVLQRCTYDITVKVASDGNSDSTTGDSGSKNMFYFQILFKNGRTSGYVLANQQLAADGFRSGVEETFKINMNYDYGEVEGIRIIPDDTISDEDSFDKLQVEYVDITKKSEGALSQTWRCEINGWISIDYRDTGALSSSGGLSGRSEADLARTFTTSASSYQMNLVVEVKTAGYDAAAERLDGILFATFTYYDQDGLRRTKTVDVYSEMYSYMEKSALNGYSNFVDGKAPKLRNESTGEGNDNMARGARIDQETMLNAGTSNYFILSLDEPNEILGVEFFASSDAVSYWNIEYVRLYTIASGDGTLYINDANTYFKDYKLDELAYSTSTNGYVLYTPNNATQNLPIEFSDNTIDVDLEAMTWKSSAVNDTSADNDTVNLYVHMRKPSTDGNPDNYSPTSIDKYSLRLKMKYSYIDSHGILNANVPVEIKAMNKDVDEYLFYYKGLNASGLTTINSISMTARENSNSGFYADANYNCFVDYVVIERVRNNVIVNTYYVDFNGTGDANSQVTDLLGTPTNKPERLGTSDQTQNLMVQLGPATQEFICERNESGNEIRDIAFALYYKTSTGTGDTNYYSKYVYLSDFYKGETITPGQVVDIRFTENDVQEIVGVQMVSQGVTASITGACIGLSDGTGTAKSWFSINPDMSNLMLSSMGQLFEAVTDRSIIPVTLTLTTAKSEGEIDAGCEDRIHMVLAYEDTNGNMRTLIVDDLNNQLISGSFNAGETAVVKLLVPDLQSIHYFDFEPQDDMDSRLVNWMIYSLTAQVGGTSATARTHDKTPNENIVEGHSGKVNVANIIMEAKVVSYRDAGTEVNTTTGKEISTLIGSGEKVGIFTETQNRFAVGSFSDVVVKAERLDGTASSDETSKLITTESSGGYIQSIYFQTTNTTSQSVNYRVTITSVESPTLSLTINITVEPSKVSTETPTVSGQTTTDAESQATGE